jgi:pyruvate dehydrogenase phosphatase
VKAYERLEEEWLKVARVSFHNGFPKAGYVGSCALVAIVHNNKLYVANAGDSKGVLLRKTEAGYERVKTSTTFNANKKYEQERLRKQFKGESDVVICKRGGQSACYVKGNLMPSRAIGDLRLKNPEFNFHNYSFELGYRKPIPKEKYTGPYISAVPDVQVFDLSKNDKFLVLATDGLWDELNRKKAA